MSAPVPFKKLFDKAFPQGFKQGFRQGEAESAWQMHNRRGMSIHDIHEIFEKPEIEIEKVINYWQDHLDSQKKEAKKSEE